MEPVSLMSLHWQDSTNAEQSRGHGWRYLKSLIVKMKIVIQYSIMLVVFQVLNRAWLLVNTAQWTFPSFYQVLLDSLYPQHF